MSNSKGVTLGQLISELQKIADEYGYDLETLTEGCDCSGPCSGAEYSNYRDGSYVLLCRGGS